MGIALLKMKIMPSGLDINLEELKEKVRERITLVGGTVDAIEEQNVAFGLKALIVTIVWPEDKETSLIDNELTNIEDVSSFDVIDFRRAFG